MPNEYKRYLTFLSRVWTQWDIFQKIINSHNLNQCMTMNHFNDKILLYWNTLRTELPTSLEDYRYYREYATAIREKALSLYPDLRNEYQLFEDFEKFLICFNDDDVDKRCQSLADKGLLVARLCPDAFWRTLIEWVVEDRFKEHEITAYFIIENVVDSLLFPPSSDSERILLLQEQLRAAREAWVATNDCGGNRMIRPDEIAQMLLRKLQPYSIYAMPSPESLGPETLRFMLPS